MIITTMSISISVTPALTSNRLVSNCLTSN
jgi:hypothetical protein